MSDPMDTPLDAEPRPRPLAVDVPKRQRTRLAKAELLGMLAVWCSEVAEDVPARVGDPGDGLRDLCQRYGLGSADIVRLLRAIGSELENSAVNRGLGEAWT